MPEYHPISGRKLGVEISIMMDHHIATQRLNTAWMIHSRSFMCGEGINIPMGLLKAANDV